MATQNMSWMSPVQGTDEDYSWAVIDPKQKILIACKHISAIMGSEQILKAKLFQEAKINEVFYDVLYKEYNHIAWEMLLSNDKMADACYVVSFPVKKFNQGKGMSTVLQHTRVITSQNKLLLKLDFKIVGNYYDEPYVIEGRFSDLTGTSLEYETSKLKKAVIAEVLRKGGFPFTTRELDVLETLQSHAKSREAGESLNITPLTMSVHCKNIVKKSKIFSPHLNTSKEVSRYLHNLGLI